MTDILKVAAVQMNPKLMKKEKNLDKILLRMHEAAEKEARLIVFPECALTGYLFLSREEALPYAESVPGKATTRIADLCQELGVYVIFGLLEIDGDKLYNTAALVGPSGVIGKYRKTHLPMFALDRLVEQGDLPLEVFQTPIGNIGILICHDITFPENARILTLRGADVIVIPTNWPRQLDIVAKHMINTRAAENFVHIIAVDRVGVERKVRFLGMSKIVNARGITKASAGIRSEEMICADIDLAYARIKYYPGPPIGKTFDVVNDRRTELYGDIVRPDVYQPRE